jgi:hypothetical protein
MGKGVWRRGPATRECHFLVNMFFLAEEVTTSHEKGKKGCGEREVGKIYGHWYLADLITCEK